MLLKTRYSIDTWEYHNTGVLIEMIYIFSFITIALREEGGLLEPFDYEDETQTHALAESVEAGISGGYLTLDTDTGITKFFDGKGVEQQTLTILPYTLDLIKENLEADPSGLDTVNTPRIAFIDVQNGQKIAHLEGDTACQKKRESKHCGETPVLFYL